MSGKRILKAAVSAAMVMAMVASAGSAGAADSLARAYNRFGFDFFQTVVDSNPDSNVFLSPASAAMALSMLYNGADGVTQGEMEQVLRLQGWSLDEINRMNVTLREALVSADTAVTLSIANSMWLKPGFKFRDDFLSRTQQAFDAELGALVSPDPINAWVKAKTNGKIDKIIQQVRPRDVLVLLNAIYFKGMWRLKFEDSLTRERDFTQLSGTDIPLPMMERADRYAYTETDSLQAIKLPYGDGRFGMYVILPGKEIDFSTFVKSIDPDRWERWRTQFKPREGMIVLPRFKLEQTFPLNGVLAAMGMKSAFDPGRANLTRMWNRQHDENLFVSDARQKTYVEVTEEGTEAAAVTSITVTLAEAVQPTIPPFEMIVDRPFVMAIVDDTTGLVLFLGAIVDPS